MNQPFSQFLWDQVNLSERTEKDVEMQHLEILATNKITNNDEQAEETTPAPEQIDQPVEETNIQDEDPPVQQLEKFQSRLTHMAEKQQSCTKMLVKFAFSRNRAMHTDTASTEEEPR
ncbi:hypothetical protein L345_11570, partial [Ophiophagus hannah]